MIVSLPSISRHSFGSVLALVFASVVLAPPLYAQSDAPSGTVSVRVVGLESDDGSVRAALNNEQNYDGDGNVRAATLSIEDGTARWMIEELPPGTYAVRLYHDENDNGELDTNMFGVPQEPFGFSNDARGSMGPPDFDEAAFTVASDSLSMTITAE